MSELRKMVVQIGGVKYPITAYEDEAYVADLAREIDKAVYRMRENSYLSLDQAMALLCLSYLDAYKKAEQDADNLRGQIAEYLEEASKARHETGEARKEIARLEELLGEKAGSKE